MHICSWCFTGAVEETVYVHTQDVSDVTYVEGRIRVRVKVIGNLPDALSTPRSQLEQPLKPPLSQLSPLQPSPSHPQPALPTPSSLPVSLPEGGQKPHWPYSSVEDMQKDEHAGLKPPLVQGI